MKCGVPGPASEKALRKRSHGFPSGPYSPEVNLRVVSLSKCIFFGFEQLEVTSLGEGITRD